MVAVNPMKAAKTPGIPLPMFDSEFQHNFAGWKRQLRTNVGAPIGRDTLQRPFGRPDPINPTHAPLQGRWHTRFGLLPFNRSVNLCPSRFDFHVPVPE